jgi:hypothetical protein
LCGTKNNPGPSIQADPIFFLDQYENYQNSGGFFCIHPSDLQKKPGGLYRNEAEKQVAKSKSALRARSVGEADRFAFCYLFFRFMSVESAWFLLQIGRMDAKKSA